MSLDHKHIVLWAVFLILVVVSLALDLGLKSHRHREKAISLKEAAIWTGVWIGLALLFNGFVHYVMGAARAMEFLTAYLIEKSLSVDNMFIFMVIFSYFKIPAAQQPKVLHWGILGAIVMRLVLILAGVSLLAHFHWVLYVFGLLLIFTAVQIMREEEKEIHPEGNLVLRCFKRFMPFSPQPHGNSFFHRGVDARWVATPLFATLLVVEASDLMFAVDSIPAVLAISRDPFIVFSSNIFAILGLRALYFLLSGFMGLFHYLKYGLGVILMFIGTKMLLTDVIHIPIGLSLGFVAFCLAVSVLLSLRRKPHA